MDTWSDQARVLVRPFRAYHDLARRSPDDEGATNRRDLFARLFVLMLVLGAFVSFTAAGRLVPLHVMSPSIAWAYVPLLQLVSLAVVRRRFARAQGIPAMPALPRVFALYLAGHGPWMVLFLAIAAVCIFSPSAPSTLLWLLGHGVLPGAVVVAFVWGVVTTFALFRSGLGLSRGAARAATSLFYAIYAAAIAGWFLVSGQLHTLFQR